MLNILCLASVVQMATKWRVQGSKHDICSRCCIYYLGPSLLLLICLMLWPGDWYR